MYLQVWKPHYSMSVRARGFGIFSVPFLLFGALTHRPDSAQAQVFDKDYFNDSGTSLRGEVGVYSDRIFRGQNLYNGTSFQPKVRGAFDMGFGELFAAVAAHVGIDQDHSGVSDDRRSFSEVDYELGDKLKFDQVSLAGGYRWYSYTRTTERLQDTGELFAELDTTFLAHPYIHIDYDTQKHEGWYYEIGFSEPVPYSSQNPRDVIVPSVTLGFSSGLDDGKHPIYQDGGLVFVGVGARAVVAFDESISLQPEVRYNFEVDDATTSDFTFGMNLVGELPSDSVR